MIEGIRNTFRDLFGVTLDDGEAAVLQGIMAAYRNSDAACRGTSFMLPVKPDTVDAVCPSVTYDDFNEICMDLYTYQLEMDTDGYVSFCRLFDVVLTEKGHLGSLLVNRQVLERMEAGQP